MAPDTTPPKNLMHSILLPVPQTYFTSCSIFNVISTIFVFLIFVEVVTILIDHFNLRMLENTFQTSCFIDDFHGVLPKPLALRFCKGLPKSHITDQHLYTSFAHAHRLSDCRYKFLFDDDLSSIQSHRWLELTGLSIRLGLYCLRFEANYKERHFNLIT